MSCFLSCHDLDGNNDHHHPPALPLDLLDEYWFFSNTLNNVRNKRSPCTSSVTTKPQQQQGLGCERSLLRTPSLPSPPNNEGEDELVVEEQAAEVDDEDLNWSSIYEGILRTTRIASSQGSSSRSTSSALQRAPSMPVVPSSDSGRRKEKEMANNNKLRHSYSTLERHRTPTNSKHQTPRSSGGEVRWKQQPVMMVRSKSALFHLAADKKWKKKSSSDLESIEVQGFKDLGFIFHKEELREDLADALPGLKNATGHGAVSEAWHHHRRRSALIRVQSETRSAAEMKDQLRMWAQAVACNARQECA